MLTTMGGLGNLCGTQRQRSSVSCSCRTRRLKGVFSSRNVLASMRPSGLRPVTNLELLYGLYKAALVNIQLRRHNCIPRQVAHRMKYFCQPLNATVGFAWFEQLRNGGKGLFVSCPAS